MARVKYRSPELVKERHRTFTRLSIFLSILFIALIIGLIYVLRMPRFQIADVFVSGTQLLNQKDIQGEVQKTFLDNYLWLIPKSNTFLYSTGALEQRLSQLFPAIKSIYISRDGFQKISIELTERKPHALWCGENSDTTQTPECYFVDDSGFIFSPAPYFSDGVYFVYKGGIDETAPVGKQLLPSEDFIAFENFVSMVKTTDLHVVSATFKDAGDFDLTLAEGARLMVNKKSSYDTLYTNISTLVENGQFASTTLSQLDYVDLRFGNKVFLKNKNSI